MVKRLQTSIRAIKESFPSLQFQPDQFKEVPVGAKVTAEYKRGFQIQAQFEPDIDSGDPERYFELQVFRIHKKTGERQLLDVLAGIDTQDANYVNSLLQDMLKELHETSSNNEESIYVADLGVEVKLSRYYVVTGSNSMWGGVDNNFATEQEARSWVAAYNRHAGNGLRIELNDEDAIIKGSDLVAVYQQGD